MNNNKRTSGGNLLAALNSFKYSMASRGSFALLLISFPSLALPPDIEASSTLNKEWPWCSFAKTTTLVLWKWEEINWRSNCDAFKNFLGLDIWVWIRCRAAVTWSSSGAAAAVGVVASTVTSSSSCCSSFSWWWSFVLMESSSSAPWMGVVLALASSAQVASAQAIKKKKKSKKKLTSHEN